MKVLFIDDEKIVREGMITVIDWEKNGCEPLRVAGTVKQALELMESYRPDLVITDIYMNETNGIKLAKILKETYPDTIVVLLSGYESFQYAREAIEVGVVKYLLKPLFPAELEELITDMHVELAKRKSGKQTTESLQKAEVYRPLALESIWKQLLYRRYQNEQEVLEKAVTAGIPCNAPSYQVVHYFVPDMQISIRPEMQRQPLPFAPLFHLPLDHTGGVLVMGEEVERVRLVTLLRALGDRWEVPLGFAAGEPVTCLPDLARSETSAQHAQSRFRQIAKDGVAHYQDTASESPEPSYPQDIEDDILHMLQYEQVWRSEILHRFFAAVEECAHGSQSALELMAARLLTAIYRTAEHFAGVEMAPYHTQLSLLCVQTGVEQMESFFQKWLTKLMEDRIQSYKTDPERLANQADRLICQNFRREEFSINDVARQLHISPGYLSRIYKRYYGRGAAEYLTMLRIEEAKRLLASGGIRQSQIALEVGYSNVYYFSTQFKKMTGLTPGEYKKQKGLGNEKVD